MLRVQDLTIRFDGGAAMDEAVHGISFNMAAGEILGLVGESGSGKTATARAIMGLLRRRDVTVAGRILFQGRDLLTLRDDQLRQVQGRQMGMVFQEPTSSLNPLMKIGRQVEEAMAVHTDTTRSERKAAAIAAMAAAELKEPEGLYGKYPFELSGGMRQRAMIAAAVLMKPDLLLCDEPTTALDVTIQAQILELLQKLNQETGMGILLISHDLQVVQKICTRAIVMENGYIVEEGAVSDLFAHPQVDYTKKLVASARGRGRRHE